MNQKNATKPDRMKNVLGRITDSLRLFRFRWIDFLVASIDGLSYLFSAVSKPNYGLVRSFRNLLD